MIKRVIKPYILGGLGNQCFSYAVGRSLSIDSNAELILNATQFFEHDPFGRTYSLQPFNISAPIERGWPFPVQAFIKGRRFLSRLLPTYSYLVQEKVDSFQRGIFTPLKYSRLGGTMRLEGCWQSERYFYNNRATILEDFRLKDPSWLLADPLAKQILASRASAFIHFRSYDEVTRGTPDFLRLNKSFYYEAMRKLKQLEPKTSEILLFSDNISMAINHISPIAQGLNVRIIPVGLDETSSTLRDFSLMRLCKNGIVANSSFSWWAGWLGEQEWKDKGAEPIRIHFDGAKFNEYYWPDRWIGLR